MYKVILVDDEMLALEGLELLVDWAAADFEIAARCRNGAEALDMITLHKPDLVVTDLYMPVMDGLSLIRTARQQGYTGRFLIVSGYDDFEKARQALPLGVSGYLLKPVDTDDAAAVLREVRKKLDEEHITFPAYHAQLSALLSGLTTSARMLPSGGSWLLVTWGSPLSMNIVQVLMDRLRSRGLLVTPHILDQREWLAIHSSTKDFSGVTALIEQHLLPCRRTLHCCPVCSDPHALRPQMQALASQIDRDTHGLMRLADDVSEAVSLLDRAGAMDAVRQLEEETLSRGGHARQYAISLLQTRCSLLLNDDPGALQQFITRCTQERTLTACVEAALTLLSPRQEKISQQVMDIVARQYARNITLEELADSLGYNAAYLGRVFRHETGRSFRSWLQDYRLEQACTLLRTTDSTIAEIAAQVGYPRYETFYERFRQNYRMSPEQYRKGQ